MRNYQVLDFARTRAEGIKLPRFLWDSFGLSREHKFNLL